MCSEFGFYLPVSFFRRQLAWDEKLLPALGTAPGDGAAVNPVNNNQFCHSSSISQSRSSD
ncbi:MAG TPA: hypothetical protein VFR08_07465 [Candidatus Angelobacter sp.]|nr:hypothetical protein [Candidatus Angelobacter sp.]